MYRSPRSQARARSFHVPGEHGRRSPSRHAGLAKHEEITDGRPPHTNDYVVETSGASSRRRVAAASHRSSRDPRGRETTAPWRASDWANRGTPGSAPDATPSVFTAGRSWARSAPPPAPALAPPALAPSWHSRAVSCGGAPPVAVTPRQRRAPGSTSAAPPSFLPPLVSPIRMGMLRHPPRPRDPGPLRAHVSPPRVSISAGADSIRARQAA